MAALATSGLQLGLREGPHMWDVHGWARAQVVTAAYKLSSRSTDTRSRSLLEVPCPGAKNLSTPGGGAEG